MNINHLEQSFQSTNLITLFLVLSLTTIYSFYLANDLRIGIPPDEVAHISKIKHVKANPVHLSPKSEKLCTHGGKQTTNPNYLAHPPLYYALAGLLSEKEDCSIVYDYKTFRYASIVLSTLSLILIISGICLSYRCSSAHTIYILYISSIPIFPYISASTNNDSLAFFSISLLIFSWLLLYKGKNSIVSITLIAISMALCLLTKATTGLQAILLSFFLLIFAPKEIRASIFYLKPNRIVPALIILIPVVYFLIMKITYGSFLPAAVSLLDSSWKKVPATMDFFGYINHYFRAILHSYTGITSHDSIYKTNIFQSYGILLIAILSITQIFRRPAHEELLKLWKFYIAGLFTTLLFTAAHFSYIYLKYRTYGYLGGIQFRYFLPLVPLIAIGYLLWHIQTKKLFKLGISLIVIPSLFLGNIFYYFEHKSRPTETKTTRKVSPNSLPATISYANNTLSIAGNHATCDSDSQPKLISFYKNNVYMINSLDNTQEEYRISFEVPVSCKEYLNQLKHIKVQYFCGKNDNRSIRLTNVTNCK
ncbi:MAG: hypothetical protein ABW170_14090 [Candidatus Thiodiazotropha sp. L084R]